MTKMQTQPLDFVHRDPAQVLDRAKLFRQELRRRRTVRDFAPTPVPKDIIDQLVMTAAGAPSGANQQPWTFVCISDSEVKRRIRMAAEEEEKAFYAGRAGAEWLDALEHLGTDWQKPFLETAPWLIAIFAQRYGRDENGRKIKHYYVPESVGIAAGFLIAACHNAGLASLTHTPAPMAFLNEICGRPDNEKPVILLVVGYPAEGCAVPVIGRKSLDEVAVFI